MLSTFINNKTTVFRQPLKLFSTTPLTGFHRDGYCRTSPLDRGNHAIAGIVTDEFLDFSAAQGNDLRNGGAGITAGCKWCLCTGRWLEAFRAYEAGRVGREAVPRVDLEATEVSALRGVEIGTLRRFAVEGQEGGGQQQMVNGNGNGVNGVNGVNGNGHGQ